MTIGAEHIARAAKCSSSTVRRLAKRTRICGAEIGRNHELQFGIEIARAFKKQPQRKAVEKLFMSLAAAAGRREQGGATPSSISNSPAGVAADSKSRSFLTQPPWQSRRSIARADILAAQRASGLGHEAFATAYSAGRVLVADEIRALYRRISFTQLSAWSRRARAKLGNSTWHKPN